MSDVALTALRGAPASVQRSPLLRRWRPIGETLGRIGPLEVRLARTNAEVRASQALRYEVFYQEMAAQADAATRAWKRDRDRFDAVSDHLLVIDHEKQVRRFGRAKPAIVGTYRLIRQDVAMRHGGFYTQDEYDVNALVARHPDLRFLELGRSCVRAPYRHKRTIELLWHGIWSYVRRHNIDAMFGCASLPGTDISTLAEPLSFLHHNALAPEEWRAAAQPDRYTPMDLMPQDEVSAKRGLRSLPPLLKGYLRLGGYVGDGAVIDRQFGTTDVLIILPVATINHRYVSYYGVDATRHAS